MLNPSSRYLQSKVTIADAASKSGFANTLGYRLVGILIPAGTEQTILRIFADVTGDDDTGAVVVNQAGEEINFTYGTVTLPTYVVVNPVQATNRGPIPPAARLAVQSCSAASTPAVQTGSVIITLVLELMEE